MSSDEDGRSDSAPTRLIYRMREHVQQVRNQFWREGINGQPSAATKRELATAAIQYWDILHEFREESVLKEGDFPDISPVRSRVGQMTEQMDRSNRRDGDLTVKQVPAIEEVDGWYLVQLTEDLDDLAKRLGFSASVKSTHDVFGIDPEYEEGGQ